MGQRASQLHNDDAEDVTAALRTVDKVLGILPVEEEPQELRVDSARLISLRDESRRAGNPAVTDEIRQELGSRGYLVQDLPGGAQVIRRT